MEHVTMIIDRMVKNKHLTVRSAESLSWGERGYCQALFSEVFRRVDTTFARYEHLPEYDVVVDWMTDTRGKGLLLIGDCGRGKSIIATGVVPVLLAMQDKHSTPVHADDFAKPYPFARSTEGYEPSMANMDYLIRCRFPIIDELGVETAINEWGERYEGFNRIVNSAERYLKPLFISTNLSTTQLLARYGERTLDRLSHLCRVVEFKGDSLR